MVEYSTAVYSSPIVAVVGGIRQYIQFLSGGVLGVSAKDGALFWNFDDPAAGSANRDTPIFHDGYVFATATAPWDDRCYCAVAKLMADKSKIKAEKVYKESTLANQHGGGVKDRFTTADRSDHKAWAHPVIAGGKLYLRDWDGMSCYDVKAK